MHLPTPTPLPPARAILHMPLELGIEDIALMIDTNVYRASSPWIGSITRHGEHGELYVWTIRHDGENDSEGTYRSRAIVTPQTLAEGFADAANAQYAGDHHGLCCLADMVADGSVASGCAQDTDVILQYALFHELVYG